MTLVLKLPSTQSRNNALPVPFPANVTAKGGIKVSKVNGVWTIEPDFSVLSDIVPSSNQLNQSKIWYYDSVTQNYALISLVELGVIVTRLYDPRIITTGNVTVSNTDTLIVMNKSSPAVTAFALPPVASRSPNGLPFEVYDWSGKAGDMTFTPNGAETIMGLSSWIVGSGGAAGTGGSLKLIPSVTLNGWLVK